jgi:hypothetical protein
LEAAVFGRLAEGESRLIRAHAAACAKCGLALRREQSVLKRLEALRRDEPTINVLGRVLDRLDDVVPRRATPNKLMRALVALGVVAGALVLASAARSRELRARLSRAW